MIISMMTIAVLLSACEVVPWAAKVDGATITQSQLNTYVSDVVHNSKYLCELSLSSGGKLNPKGPSGGSYTSTFVDTELSELIIAKLVSNEVKLRRLTINNTDISLARTDLVASLGAQTPQCPYSGSEVFSSFPISYQISQIKYLAQEEELAANLGGISIGHKAIAAYYSSHTQQFTDSCIKIIEVGSKAQADGTRATIEGGVSFSTMASKVSLDQTTAAQGGVVGCVAPGPPPFSPLQQAVMALPVGQISQPIAFQSNWIIFKVYKRYLEPEGTVTTQIRQDLIGGQAAAFNTLIKQLAFKSHIVVNSMYGEWKGLNAVSGPITSPPPPPARFMLPTDVTTTPFP